MSDVNITRRKNSHKVQQLLAKVKEQKQKELQRQATMHLKTNKHQAMGEQLQV